MGKEFVTVEQKGAVSVISLNRPDKLNAITVGMDLELVRAIRAAEADDTIRSILLRGEGRSFSAGHDLIEVGKIMHDLGEKAADWTNVYARVWPEGSPVQAISECNKPVVTALQGYVVGMMVPAVLSADLIVATDDMVMHLEVLRSGGGAGLSPYVGLMPPKLLNELALLGKINSAQLLAAGVVNRVTSQEALFEDALAMAQAATDVLPVSTKAYKNGVRDILRRQGVGDPSAMTIGGVDSHGNDTDNNFWRMAADKSVADALRWRDEQTRTAAAASS